MATIINNPGESVSPDSPNNGMGFLLGAIVLVIFFFIFLYYGLPYMTTSFRSSVPQVQVPGKINVNVKSSK